MLDSYNSFWRTKVDCEGVTFVGRFLFLFCVVDTVGEEAILREDSSTVSGFTDGLCGKFGFPGLEDVFPFLFFALGVMEVGDTAVDVDDKLGCAEDLWEL